MSPETVALLAARHNPSWNTKSAPFEALFLGVRDAYWCELEDPPSGLGQMRVIFIPHVRIIQPLVASFLDVQLLKIPPVGGGRGRLFF